MSAGKAKLVVGQVLHRPPSQCNPRWTEFVVIGIGRKWAALRGGGRCTLDTLMLDLGDYGHSSLVADKTEYEKYEALRLSFACLVRDVRNARMTAGMTLEKIAQVRALLGIEVKS